MKYYNKALGCHIELDEFDMQASREGTALKTASINRINRANTTNKHKQRFTKSKHCKKEINYDRQGI